MSLRLIATFVMVSVSLCAAQSRPTRPSGPDPIPLPKNVNGYQDVEYARGKDKPLLMDLFVPRDAKDPLPLIVWIHGGGWVGGNKEPCPALPMATKGYVVATINYRLAPEWVFPAQIEDCKAAIRFLRANAAKYNIDPKRIGVWGISAGGHLGALLGTSGDVKEVEGEVGGNLDQSSRVQCVVDFCGPTDLGLFLKSGDGIAAAKLVTGGDMQKALDLIKKMNPITYVTKDDPPFLIVHGDQDKTVPIESSQLLEKALKDAKVEVTYHVAKGRGHNVGGPDLAPLVFAFIENHLKVPATQPAKNQQ